MRFAPFAHAVTGSRAWAGMLVLLALMVLASSSGCMFNRVRKDNKILQHYGSVAGTVEVENWDGLPLLVAAGRLPEGDDRTLVVIGPLALKEPDDFELSLEEGSYILGAFEDQNRNLVFDDGERGVLSEPFDVSAGEIVEGMVLRISQVFQRSALERYEPLRESPYAIGEIAPLSDPRLGKEPAGKGLWEPSQYALDNQPGVYFLEPYDPERTPVLFVHGMSGYPQEFDKLIGRLDTERFQPWVFLYPSGYHLADVADFLHELMVQLETLHRPERTCVVAHSMGGLVSRGFLSYHLADGEEQSVRTLVTLASPLDGMPSAAMGVKMSPAVVPAWRDLSPGSEYLEFIYGTPLGGEVEYHLLFGYKKGGSDGTVPVLSQLRVEAQAEAEVLRGFPVSHVGILADDAAAAQVLAALDRCRGDVETGRIAPRPLGE